jgi:branched-chain amino acid aminotransferase
MPIVPFDDRDGEIWFDGKMVPWREARLHVLSHGLHYASGVFEGERAYAGNIFKLRAHSERLIQSGRILGFEIPYTAEEIDAACVQVVQANGLTDAYVRPIAWRGTEQLSVSAQQTKIHLAIATWAWPNLFGNDRMKGVRLAMATWKRPHPETAPTASKAAGLYMIGTLSKHAAEAQGYDDALMLDWRGQVSEATGANIFFAMNGELHTPTPDCFLDGITRRTVISIARRHQMKVV